MALRTMLGCLPIAALAAFALSGCKDDTDAKDDAGAKTDAGKPSGTSASAAGPFQKRCVQLAKACGAKDKHEEKLVEECNEAAKKQLEKGCTDKVVAMYDCYEKEICADINKVWAMDDFRVLADRHKKCVAERDAADACVGK